MLFVLGFIAKTVPTSKFNVLGIILCVKNVKLFYRLCDITHIERAVVRASLSANTRMVIIRI